jgi:hypothetical protein
MKANKTPEKIYLQVCGDCNANDCENCKFEDLEDNVTWCKDKIFDKDIEYIRTDALIEKAIKFFSPHIQDNSGGYDRANVIENFRNYIKEE